MARCKCCDSNEETNFWWKDGYYCKVCYEVIKKTIREAKYGIRI